MSLNRLRALFALVLVVLAVGFAVAWGSARRVQANEEAVRHTQQVLSELRLLQGLVVDSEVSKYVYHLTNQPSALAPYAEAKNGITGSFERLRRLTADNPDQQQRVRFLREAVEQKYGRIDSLVRAQREQGPAAVRGLVANERSERLMRRVQLILNEMMAAESALLGMRSTASEQSVARMLALFGLLALLSLGLVGLLYAFAQREVETSRLETEGLSASNAELSTAVSAQTAALQQANRDLEGLTQELQRSNRELQDFAYVASHDLQEPLRKIRAFSDLITADYGEALDEEARRYLGRIDDAAARMSRLISDLLAYSRVTSKARPFEPVDLGAVAAAVVDDLSVAVAEAKAEVTLGALPTLDADAGQMHQVFQNLIANALKFRAPGVAPRVEVACRTDVHPVTGRPAAHVTVQDNGIGFEPRHAERIFTPFERLHSRQQYAGTGIGLAIVRRIVERHGGTIHAESAPGTGATFHLVLPLEHLVEESAAVPA